MKKPSPEAPLYEGKSKSLYKTERSGELLMRFRDEATAFDGKKKEVLAGKGLINNAFNACIMEQLQERGIATHFLRLVGERDSLVRDLKMLPVECVVRNIAAGSICKRLGLQRGGELRPPIFEFYYKDDALGDPLVNESHILNFGWANAAQVAEMREQSLRINEILLQLFAERALLLVDLKLEFGAAAQGLMLGDEFTPDSCRLWDSNTLETLDKDRFRQDLGGVLEGYREIARRFDALPDSRGVPADVE